MHTEITDLKAEASAGWIFFDAECRFCAAGRRRWGRIFERRGFVWLPLQTPGAAKQLGVSQEQLLAEMWVLPAKGAPLKGVNAWIELLRSVWWLWPLVILLGLPGINGVGQFVYRWIARNRYCLAGRCRVRPAPQTHFHHEAILLLIAAVAVILALGWNWPGWILMWTLGVVLGLAGKWLTWRAVRATGLPMPAKLSVAWFLLWPGLDAWKFFAHPLHLPRPALTEWLIAATKLALGTTLLWAITPLVWPEHPLAASWLAMIATVLCLHFGFFHLLSLAWRAVGVNAAPIMRRPLIATSLAEFWGERWNTAFSVPARKILFLPLARRHGVTVANVAVFLASGVLHELVISVPARGGYGLPTAYFALQGAGILFERSRAGRALGLGHGWRGWLFMFSLTAAPLYWLFHPPFVRNVVQPMLQSIGAT